MKVTRIQATGCPVKVFQKLKIWELIVDVAAINEVYMHFWLQVTNHHVPNHHVPIATVNTRSFISKVHSCLASNMAKIMI